jgi:RNA polymerase sigma-70 factor (ECF subfamily)
MRTAMARLTPDQQRVLGLRFRAEMSVIEVAEILGKKPNAIKALQFRALTALRRALEGER